MSKAEATKARILAAALDEFSTHGVAGARVDRIAATAGCNKNLLYIYFGSKDDLFAAVLDEHLIRVYADETFTPDDLPGFAGRAFDFAMARPDLMRLVAWSTLEQAGGHPGRSASHDAKVDALARARAAGAPFDPEFVVTTVMALATAWSPAFPFGTAMHPDRSPDLAALRAQVVTAVERLVGQVS